MTTPPTPLILAEAIKSLKDEVALLRTENHVLRNELDLLKSNLKTWASQNERQMQNFSKVIGTVGELISLAQGLEERVQKLENP